MVELDRFVFIMPQSPPAPSDFIAWVRRVNNRWIVHEGLNQSANAYLDHLQATDPERLLESCHAAHQLTHRNEGSDDPKPKFYGALFSRATPEEAGRFLSEHWFVSSIIPATRDITPRPFGVAPSTLEQIEKLRAEVATVLPHKG